MEDGGTGKGGFMDIHKGGRKRGGWKEEGDGWKMEGQGKGDSRMPTRIPNFSLIDCQSTLQELYG